ncbi:lamin tail domain-containing protein [Candidatus Bipolaricaulota bacterium]
MALVLALVALVGTAYANSEFDLMTWNVRGYPETSSSDQAWFSAVLAQYQADILCVQEIANDDRVSTFLANEADYADAAFLNSSDGQDNAIFVGGAVALWDVPDPSGFSHPAQLAYVTIDSFTAYVLTVHLAWTDTNQRAIERGLLADIAKALMALDPDLIVAGDFNTTERPGDTVLGLAAEMEMEVVTPLNDAATTCGSGNSRYDHIFVSSSIMEEYSPIAEVIVFEDTDIACSVSDHKPVLARFGGSATPEQHPAGSPDEGSEESNVTDGPDIRIECIVYDGYVFRSESDEYVQIKNYGNAGQDLRGWVLADLNDSGQEYEFTTSYVLEPGLSIRVYTNEIHEEWGGFSFGRGSGVWNNTTPDTAVLRDGSGQEIDRCTYTKCGERCCSSCVEHQED